MSELVGTPRPGFYRRKLVKGGPYVGVVIFYACPWNDECQPTERSRPLLCMVNGEHADPVQTWEWVAGQKISEDEYNYLMADAAHATEFRPTAPRANPRKKIELLECELPW